MDVDLLLKKALKRIAINTKAIETLEPDQREMIRGVVEFGDTTVKEVMVPRIDVNVLSKDAPREEILERIIASDHTRFPVYDDSIDNIIGILYVKDVLRCLVKAQPFAVETLVRPAFFVPESKHIDDLLREFRKKRVHIAIVVDEYGGVSGIVCMEDILEEIIGDIQDEFDNEQEDVVQTGDGAFLCDARVNLEDLAEKTGLRLPIDDFDTLGGFVFNLFGKIPEQNEQIAWKNITFLVTAVEGHRIKTVQITAGPRS
ncbi:MAG: hemolysin family protein [Spirochaetaceae bacterium]|jgi:CBS domain containing-hemolysin-like protein|nr:hemolysin family protein [Spirochaetaceae bacterium]